MIRAIMRLGVNMRALMLALVVAGCGGRSGVQDAGVDMLTAADMALVAAGDMTRADDMAQTIVLADMTQTSDVDMASDPVADMTQVVVPPSPDMEPICPILPTCGDGSPCCNGALCIGSPGAYYCWNPPGGACDLNTGPLCWGTSTMPTYCGADHLCHAG